MKMRSTPAPERIRQGQRSLNTAAFGTVPGIAYGVSKTEFAPEQATTRQQMAAFLYRYAKLRGMDVSGQNDLSAFRDSGTVDAYAKTAVAWAVDSGIIFGTETDTLSPNMTLPREQCAAMLYRLMKTA